MLQNAENITNLSIDLLVPNHYQPRKFFNQQALNELANSIKEYGILNPILVRKKEDKYEIIAGERRFRAAKIIGLSEVPVVIKNMEDAKVAEVALIENLQRENINPIEEAKAYESIIKLSNITQQKLSEMIGKSQSYIANKIRLLSLSDNIQEALIERKISERHARSLMTVADIDRQTELLEKIIEEKLTVKDLDNIINEKKITEEEIQSAINDIIKSLSFSENEDNDNKESLKEKQKEKEESDKMDNGNFFPNFNNQVGNNNNISLNSMNMQTMNQNVGAMAPVEETVMPTINPNPVINSNVEPQVINSIPDFGIMQTPTNQQPQMPVQSTNQEQIMPEISNPVVEQPQMVANTPNMENQMIDVPLFNGAVTLPLVEAPIEQSQPEIQNQPIEIPEMPQQNLVQDIPLFNEQNLVQQQPIEVPIETAESQLEQTQISVDTRSVEEQLTQPLIEINPEMPQPVQMVQEQPIEVSATEAQPQVVVDTPLFETPLTQAVMETSMEISQPEINTTETQEAVQVAQEQPIEVPTNEEEPQAVLDTPLFGEPLMETVSKAAETETNINESFYEVPINISPVIEAPQAENKLIKVQELLSSNGIEYKSYSNEKGYCIIIEL